MRTLKITVAYDGTRLVGWQRQAAGDSVQGLLEEALARFEGSHVTVHGAGRTDAGVHALGQVASAQISTDHAADALVRGLNAHLPEDVRVLAVQDAAPGFHARFSARRKTYRYLLRNTPVASPFDRAYAWHLPGPLDVAAMRTAAAALVGTHDFSAFQSVGTLVPDAVRTILRSEIVEWPDGHPASSSAPPLLAYEVSGDGFLRHMVRAIVGTLVETGRGWRDPAAMAAVVAGRSRGAAGRTAPAQGLFLVSVDYD
jgi:tRNA pseudouridine38-40 synthase